MTEAQRAMESGSRPGEQGWDPDRYARQARFVADLGMPVVELLGPQSGEKILDLGCGDGALTLKLRDMGVDVTGVDASAPQIEAARALGLDARVMDGQRLDLPAETFDAVFSNAALHWMDEDPDAVIRGVWQALKPGGRFVAEMGGGDNVGRIRRAVESAFRRRGLDPDLYNPWYFPEPDEYRVRLESVGFACARHPADRPADPAAWRAGAAGSTPSRKAGWRRWSRPRPTRSRPRWPGRSSRRCATPTASGPQTMSACVSPPTSRDSRGQTTKPWAPVP